MNEALQIAKIANESKSRVKMCGDELRVRQILMHILSNAVKYTPVGGRIDFCIRGIPYEKQDIRKSGSRSQIRAMASED